jgi:hypothetical protein
VLLGLTGLTLDSLVLETKRSEWDEKIVPKWFAKETAIGQKTPGYFKEEFSSTKGKFIGLRFFSNYYCECIKKSIKILVFLSDNSIQSYILYLLVQK